MCRAVRGPPKRAAAAGKAPNYMLMPHFTLSSSGASLRVCIFARICGQACDMSKTHKVTKATLLGGQKGPWKVVRGKCGKQRRGKKTQSKFYKDRKEEEEIFIPTFPHFFPHHLRHIFSVFFLFLLHPGANMQMSFLFLSGIAGRRRFPTFPSRVSPSTAMSQ